MSREGLKNFVQAVERNQSLQRALQQCKNTQMLIEIAARYDFHITQNDLDEDNSAEEITTWFKISRIAAIKRHVK